MPAIKWQNIHSVNIESIDEQHRYFLSLLNDVFDQLNEKKFDKIPQSIKKLSVYADYHFKTEEKYFDKFKYENAAVHKKAHEQLRAKLKQFSDESHNNPKRVGEELLVFLERWFLVHLKGMDLKYVGCFQKHGLK